MLPQITETTDNALRAATANENREMAEAGVADENPVEVEEIRTEPASTSKVQPRKSAPEKKEEPSPLLLDPYEFEHCTITIVYTRVGDQQATVSVHNHKDDPIVKTFPLVEVPLPLEIACVIEKLFEIWPDGRVSATMALMPREGEAERRTVVSIRAGSDTPVILAGPVSEFPLPTPIAALLDELKELLPARAMQRIEKEAKERSRTPSRAAPAKSMSSASAKPAPGQVDGKTQMSLF
jgi:hypothetical protein